MAGLSNVQDLRSLKADHLLDVHGDVRPSIESVSIPEQIGECRDRTKDIEQSLLFRISLYRNDVSLTQY